MSVGSMGRTARFNRLERRYRRLCGWGLLLAAYFSLYWNAHGLTPICFDDCRDYVALMGESIFSGSYWEFLVRPPRPASIPVIYSLFGTPSPGAAMHLVRFQISLSFLAWITFSMSVASLADGPVARAATFLAISSGMFARGYHHFNQYLLSDSIALSLLLLWLAILVRGQHCMAWLAPKSVGIRALGFGAFITLTGLVSNARDTHVYFVLLGMPVVWHGIARYSKGAAAATMLVILGIAVLQDSQSTVRHVWNLTNVITGAILPHSERVEFFEARGMRISDDEVARYRRLGGAPSVFDVSEQITEASRSRHLDNGKLLDEVFAQNRGFIASQEEFLVREAKSAYVSFLVSHPAYVVGNIVQHADIMLNPSTPDQADDPTGPVMMPAYPRAFSVIDYLPLTWLVGLSFLATAALAAERRLFTGLGGAGLFLVVAGMSNAVIAFHGDLWEVSEMERHCLIGSIVFKTGCGVLLLAATNLRRVIGRRLPTPGGSR